MSKIFHLYRIKTDKTEVKTSQVEGSTDTGTVAAPSIEEAIRIFYADTKNELPIYSIEWVREAGERVID